MIKLKSLISEHISNDLIYLKKYLTMPEAERKEELANEYPHFINTWLRNNEDIPEYVALSKNEQMDDYEKVEWLKQKDVSEYQIFIDWLYEKIHKIDPPPTFLAMEYQSIVKNQWLIHFSNNATDIWREQKFSLGVEDYDKLGYTTYYGESSKKYGGFNFAYRIQDFSKYGRSRGYGDKNGWKYGNEAVMFISSGIMVWHWGDEERQVIFRGNEAKNIVLLEYMDGEWGVTRKDSSFQVIYKTEKLEDLVDWVVANFNQYKNVLLP
jgi:hypothetical protein